MNTNINNDKSLYYKGKEIRRDGQMFDLYGIFAAAGYGIFAGAGSPINPDAGYAINPAFVDHRPRQWLKSDEAIFFMHDLAVGKEENPQDYYPENFIVHNKQDGLLMAYRDIALAYAAHLDPNLHAWLQRELTDEDICAPHLEYEGHPIGCKGPMLNLTSMWIAVSAYRN